MKVSITMGGTWEDGFHASVKPEGEDWASVTGGDPFRVAASAAHYAALAMRDVDPFGDLLRNVKALPDEGKLTDGD